MTFADLAPGDAVFTAAFPVSREHLAAYADASGDHNPIHLDEAAAKAAGLPDVIAHGMFTMGLVSRAVLEWIDGAGIDARLTEFSARFAKPVVVPAETGAIVEVEAKVRKADDDSVELALTAYSGGEKVLVPSRATLTRS
ncbi:MaoC family dehydratase N-terminal domain-containing protein [Glycomyces sp. L485]|uniref:MaoC/PaaZ C-terminal domain-containing protein n=1 Tax=Glycomyces sp. L485 TaxID=2909235 RepID=UPI001F4AC1CF|nr:MaoC/PaaZ C-terminal domain-containing protein [Glycomyces sp. L485]MCH7230634.1 MaoC family dehydratase N-terminal domain-containing protein [Glycomyces sp. L485]